ncbi:MAG: hypothetical protein AB7G24_00905 [Novosphingobium sp.]
MNIHTPLSPITRLQACTALWCAATGRSRGALSSIVANDGGFFTRLDSPGATTTVATLQKFARFLGDAANWPEGHLVPVEVSAFLHAVGITPPAAPPSTGQAAAMSATSIPDSAGGTTSAAADRTTGAACAARSAPNPGGAPLSDQAERRA